jgi:hypothetical protein
LFRLFRFYTKTKSFDVSIEPKQTEDQPKQFDREHILLFLTENLGFFRFLFFVFFLVFFVIFGFFGLFRNSLFRLFRLFRFYTEKESFDVRLNRNKQKNHLNSLKESIFGYLTENLELFRFVLVCYETLLFVFGFTKQTRNRSCFGLFRFEPKFIFVCFEDTLLQT